jgi:16S rRNA (cytosine1402-N4)-methyltransferase
MLKEILAAMAPADGEVYVDGTFGGGGTARGLLDAAGCEVWGVDRDPAAVNGAAALIATYGGRLRVLTGRFSEMAELLDGEGVTAVDGIALDLGVSSDQLDAPLRGFSFANDGPLDMRMEGSGQTAADVVNTGAEEDLADIIHRFGQDRRARRIARAIVAARAERPISRTLELAAIVARAAPARQGPGRIHPATRTFQALRIHVNNELGPGGELACGLMAAERLLAPRGRLAVLSFHSLEDGAVKSFLRTRSGTAPRPSRHAPPHASQRPASFRLAFRGVQKPDENEIRRNPRSRSARLRAAIRTDAAAWEAVT